jgi:hypothetical protein
MTLFVLADAENPLISVERAEDGMRRAHDGEVAAVHMLDGTEQSQANGLQ